MRGVKCHLKSDRVKKGVRPYSNGDIKNIARSGSKKAIRHMLEDFKNERQTYNDIRIDGRQVSTRRVIIEAMSRHHPFSKYFNGRSLNGSWKFLECGGVSGKMENIEDIKSHRDKIMDKCECCRFKNNKDYLKELAEFFKKEWNIEYERQNFGDYIITSSCLNKKQGWQLYVYSCRGDFVY